MKNFSFLEILLTLDPVAKYLNTARFIVYRVTAQKSSQYLKAAAMRFTRETVEAWLRKNDRGIHSATLSPAGLIRRGNGT
jgi:hypothetical protein